MYWKKPWNWTKTTFNYPVFFICPISPSFSFSGVYFAWLWTHFDFLYWDTTILLLLSCEFLETLVMQLLMLIATIFHCYILISLFLFSLLCEFSDLMEARRKSCIVGKECIFWRRLTCDFCLFDLLCPSWNIQFFIVFQFQFCPIFIFVQVWIFPSLNLFFFFFKICHFIQLYFCPITILPNFQFSPVSILS